MCVTGAGMVTVPLGAAGLSIELVGAIGLILGLCLYVSSAFVLLRPPIEVYRALLFAPWFALRKAWIILVVSRRKRETSSWVRTSREVLDGK